jgi:hypothetical protein
MDRHRNTGSAAEIAALLFYSAPAADDFHCNLGHEDAEGRLTGPAHDPPKCERFGE